MPQHAEPIRFDFDAAVLAALSTLPIQDNTGLIRATLQPFAVYAQRLPDAQGKHTLWHRTLVEVQTTLAAVLPSTTTHSPTSTDKAIGILCQTVLEQLAASLAVWRVELLDQHGQALGDWVPMSGPMTISPNAHFYRVYRRRDRLESERLALNLARLAKFLAAQVLPPAALGVLVQTWAKEPEASKATPRIKPLHNKIEPDGLEIGINQPWQAHCAAVYAIMSMI